MNTAMLLETTTSTLGSLKDLVSQMFLIQEKFGNVLKRLQAKNVHLLWLLNLAQFLGVTHVRAGVRDGDVCYTCRVRIDERGFDFIIAEKSDKGHSFGESLGSDVDVFLARLSRILHTSPRSTEEAQASAQFAEVLFEELCTVLIADMQRAVERWSLHLKQFDSRLEDI